MKLTKLTLSLLTVSSIFFSQLSFGQEYKADIQSRVMNAARNVSSLDFTKDNLNFNFSLSMKNPGQYYVSGSYLFTSDEQISCMEASVAAAKRALMNPEHRAFLRAMKVDHVTVKLLDLSKETVGPMASTYGPSIVDDPYFILSSVINNKGQCMFATEKQLNDQFMAWEKSYSKTGGLKELSHDLAEEITNVNKHFDDITPPHQDVDRRVASQDHHRKQLRSPNGEGRRPAVVNANAQ